MIQTLLGWRRLLVRANLVVRVGLAAAGLGVVLGHADQAVAQDQKELSQARAKFQQAIELEQAGNWSAALRLFREVGQVRMTPQVRFHIATCEMNLGKLVAALGGYKLALADADSVGPAFRKEVEDAIDQMNARIPKLVIERGAGAEAATIDLDGVSLGASSIGVEVSIDPGPHLVSARAPGFEPFSETISVDEKQTKTVTVTLEKSPVEAGAASQASQSPTPTDLGPKEPPSMVPVYVAGGAGVAGLAVGGVFLFLRQQSIDKLTELCGRDGDPDTCGELNDTPDEATARDEKNALSSRELLMFVGFGVGAAGLGTAAVLYILNQPSDEPASAAIRLNRDMAVHFGAPGAETGVSVVGRF